MEKLFDFDGKMYSFNELKNKFDEDIKRGEKQKNVRWSETLKLIEGTKILDFGCWAGATSKSISELGFDVLGIDNRQSAIDIANTFFKTSHTEFEVRDIFSNPFPESSFNCIVFTEVIEHVDNPAQFLKSFFKFLKPGGFLILSTPNATSLKNILYALSYRKYKQRINLIMEIENEDPSTGTHKEHLYNWDFPTIIRLLTRNGFVIKEHSFVRSGPISFKIFGKKITLIKGESQFLKFIPTLMVHHLIKAQKPQK